MKYSDVKYTMPPQIRPLLKKALMLIEKSRYRVGTTEFLIMFIENWAYLQSNLYQPASKLPQDLVPVAHELTHVIATAMKMAPTKDILGYIFAMSKFHLRRTFFHPTPSELAQMLARIIHDKANTSDKTTFYEPCSGTGINSILWMDELIQTNGIDAMKHVEIHLEDIDNIMVKSSFLQLAHYFATINAWPNRFSIVGIDVITRIETGVAYVASSYTEADNTRQSQ